MKFETNITENRFKALNFSLLKSPFCLSCLYFLRLGSSKNHEGYIYLVVKIISFLVNSSDRWRT